MLGINIIRQGTIGVKEFLGKFVGTISAGFHLTLPILTKVKIVDVQPQTKDSNFFVITNDNVTAKINQTHVYRVDAKNVSKFVYGVDKPDHFIGQRIEASIRAEAAKMSLVKLCSDTQEIQSRVMTDVATELSNFGIILESVMIPSVMPNSDVQNSMNAVMSARRNKEAAIEKAEGERQTIILQAQADMECRHLKGKGIALELKAILEGRSEAISKAAEGLGVKPEQIMEYMIQMQKIEANLNIANSPNSKIVFRDSNDKDSLNNVLVAESLLR